ncbi:MAG: 2-oxoglutarate dehydrogenase E1 component, partial [Nonlabens sp.]|nr:2-oxoglutarate dehydrogenase E1 component [Nonlabens sp.]
MDKFSFLNAAHTAYFAQLYDEYLVNPDKVEPSWRAFFQGFDFGMESASDGVVHYVDAGENKSVTVPDTIQKEFKVVQLIDAYRTRGHLFTKTNPVRERRQYTPTLDLVNFGLSDADLNTVFDSGELVGIGKATLKDIIAHLKAVYCESIGVEYMYIRNPEERKWIQNWLHKNNNHASFSGDEKKQILKKLNEAVSFESFLHTKYVGQKRFSLEGNESLIPALDSLIERAADK